jgi:signal transduction histidine kinase/PAS domain-containing protein
MMAEEFGKVIVGILYPTSFLIAWKFGFRYSLFSIVLLVLGATYFVFHPAGQFNLMNLPDNIRIFVFIATSIPTCYIVSKGATSEKHVSHLKGRFERSTSAINLGVWYCDLPFDELIWDREVKEHFWLPPDAKVTIDTFYERIHPDDRQMTKNAIDTAIRNRSPYDIIYRTVNPEDPAQIKYIRAIGWTDYDENGNPLRFDGVTLDNTHLKKVSQDLEDSLEVVETINRVGTSLSGELDQKKLVQQVTVAATQLAKAEFGAFFYNLVDEKGESYTLYTVSGVPIENFTKFPMPRNTAIFSKTFNGEGILRSDDITQSPLYGKNAPYFGMPKGHLPVVSYLAVPVISRTGEVIGGLFLGHKNKGVFTEREEKIVAGLAAQIAIAMDNARLFEKAHEAVRIRDEFMSISSHELRTPLTSLKMQLQLFNHLIKRGTPASEDQIHKIVEVSERQVNRLNSLVEDLLDVSRISSGKLTLKFEPVDLGELVRDVVDRYLPLVNQNRCTIDVEVPPVLKVIVDRIRFEQILINLITNAFKYAPGSRIEIKLAEIAAEIHLSIKDNGPGIRREDQGKIFQRFERVTSRTGQVGLGLGLYIVQQIIEAHGGKIELKSDIGKGAEFVITIPAKGA